MISGMINLFEEDKRRKKKPNHADIIRNQISNTNLRASMNEKYSHSNKVNGNGMIITKHTDHKSVLRSSTRSKKTNIQVLTNTEEYKIEKIHQTNHENCIKHDCKNQGGFNCPMSCSDVIEEYKLKKMGLMREKCDHNSFTSESIDDRLQDASPKESDGEEIVDNRTKLNIAKLKCRFERNDAVRRSQIFSSSDSNEDSGNEMKTGNENSFERRKSRTSLKSSNTHQNRDSASQLKTHETNTSSMSPSDFSSSSTDIIISDEKYEDEFEKSIDSLSITNCRLSSESAMKLKCCESENLEDNNQMVQVEKSDVINDFSAVETRNGPSVLKLVPTLSDRSSSDSNLGRLSGRIERSSYTQIKSNLTQSGSISKKNRSFDLIHELIETEKSYIESLQCIVEDYIPELKRSDVPPSLRGQKYVIFGNVEKIYEFHSAVFLRDLESFSSNWMDIGKCFLKHEKYFDIYSMYAKNKPKSDEFMNDYGNFFEAKRISLGHSLNLSSQLLKPIQRLARYSLLLQKLLSECAIGCDAHKEIKAAKDMIVFQLRHGDDLLVMDCIKNCDVNLTEQGKLLRQDEFLLLEENGKTSTRRVFLFEELILLSVPNKGKSKEFICTNSMKMNDVGFTDYGDITKFIIWFRKYQFQKYTLQALSPEVKSAWVQEITNILLKQAESYKKAREEELAKCGMAQTRIPIKEQKISEDDETSNKQFYSMRSLRGVPGEIKPKKVNERTTWYCTIRSDDSDAS